MKSASNRIDCRCNNGSVGDWNSVGIPCANPLVVVEVVFCCCNKQVGGSVFRTARRRIVVENSNAPDPSKYKLRPVVSITFARSLLPSSRNQGDDAAMCLLRVCRPLVIALPTMFFGTVFESLEFIWLDSNFL